MKGTSQRILSAAFQQEAVQLVLTSGKSAVQIAKDRGVSDAALSCWVRAYRTLPNLRRRFPAKDT